MSKLKYDEVDEILIRESSLSAGDHQDLVKVMKSFAESSKPKIGIFWLDTDPDDPDLFGISKIDEDKIPTDNKGRKIYPKLHYQIYDKIKFKNRAKGIKDPRFESDYTKIPRGRINKEGNKYVVYVGSWIKEYKDMLTPLIQYYFKLNKFEYQIDSHWELGHGFSGG